MTTNQQGAATVEQGKDTQKPNAGAGEQQPPKATPEEIAADQRKRAEKAEGEAKTERELREAAEKRAADAEAALAAAANGGKGADAEMPAALEAEIVRIAQENDVDPEWAKQTAKVLHAASIEVNKANLTAEFQKQEQQAKAERVKVEFDKAFERVATSDPFKEISINKDRVRELQLANPTQTVEQIITDLYGEVSKKPEHEVDDTPEDGTKNGAERGGGTIDFEKITPEQREAVMADPEMKAKYFAFLDSKGQ